MTENTRRELLRIAGSTTLLGFAGNVAATEGEQTAAAEAHELSYDLVVQNNSGQRGELTVSVYEADGSNEKRTETPALARSAQLEHAGASRGFLDLSEGTYVVEATQGDSSATTTWYVPEGGVPEWNALSVMSVPSGDIKIREQEV